MNYRLQIESNLINQFGPYRCSITLTLYESQIYNKACRRTPIKIYLTYMIQFSIRKIYEIQPKITPDCLLCDDRTANIFAVVDLFVTNECRSLMDEHEESDEESIESHSPSIYTALHFWGFHILHSVHYNEIITIRTNECIHWFE